MATTTLTKGTTTLTKGILVGMATTLVLLGTAFSGGGRADADPTQESYVHQLQEFGIPETSDQMLANGYGGCADLRNGGELFMVTFNLEPHAGLTSLQARYEVVQAVKWLCPDESWKLTNPHAQ